MISYKRRQLTMMLLNRLVQRFDTIRTLSRILGLPVNTVQSWMRRYNISDNGLSIIANNPKTTDIYNLPEFEDIRNEEWH